MKKHFIVLLLLTITSLVHAQNCKPDSQSKDKITGQSNIAWQAPMYESSLGARLTTSADTYISLQLGRYGEYDMLSIIITKYEESLQNAVFETQYKAEEGKQFFLAFSEGGPLTYTAQAVQTSTKMNNLLKKLVTTVIISTALTKEDVETLRKAFNTGDLTAFRIFFANNMTFEGDVKDKKNTKIKQKVVCYGDYYDKNPIN